MRVIQSERKRPLDLLALGAGGHVAAACSVFGVRGDVEVWDVASGMLRLSPTVSEREVRAVAFTPEGKHLFLGGENGTTVFDTNVWKEIPAPDLTLRLGFPEFAVSSAGNLFLTTGSRNFASGIECRDVKEGWPSWPLWTEGPHPYLGFGNPAVSPEGSRVVVTSHASAGDLVRNAIELRNAQTGKILTRIPTDAADPIKQLAFTADGSRLLARSSGRTVKVFDATTGDPAGELVHPGRPYVTGMAVHPGGLLACSRNNGMVCFWDVEKGELVRLLDWKLGKLVSVAFSPDGNIGAAGTEDGQVVVWDVDT